LRNKIIFVIPSGARNLSRFSVREKKERFLAPLGMTEIRYWNYKKSGMGMTKERETFSVAGNAST
jgi:hypothetical protein